MPQQMLLKTSFLREHTDIRWNYTAAELYEQAVQKQEGTIVNGGPLAVKTGKHTGRAVNDRFVVEETSNRDQIWWGKINKAFPEKQFNALKEEICAHLKSKQVFVQDCYAGADSDHRFISACDY